MRDDSMCGYKDLLLQGMSDWLLAVESNLLQHGWRCHQHRRVARQRKTNITRKEQFGHMPR
jgi:hypothetical protein